MDSSTSFGIALTSPPSPSLPSDWEREGGSYLGRRHRERQPDLLQSFFY
ncbi:unnamed protein product [Musa acuminata subsp. malaccensis]|uniref:(wild Malaysian banana) hypothetical protein n=1 Tax=Musa acuminata subsp. malaccensis TaxID=214687 RepID=A0A804K2S4_MUSAM|nr:unnamed protein product [Musa acuminata subsp. malaccensis]